MHFSHPPTRQMAIRCQVKQKNSWASYSLSLSLSILTLQLGPGPESTGPKKECLLPTNTLQSIIDKTVWVRVEVASVCVWLTLSLL